MRNLKLAATCAAVVSLFMAGCGSAPPAEQKGAAVEDRTGKPVETPGVTTVTPERPGESGLPAILRDPKSILSKRSVYFDFDSYVIKDEFKPLVEAHARFLVSNPNMKILVQGNADERGSREYNLALGQKRSEALKKALAVLGAKESQLEAVSLGEEKPKCTEHDEGCWSQNRRDDMLYGGEY